MTADRSATVARAVDAVQYAVGLTILVAVVILPLSLLAGLGLWLVKYGLFVVGVLSGLYATFLAWPRSPEALENEGADGDETRVQAFIRRFPPATWYPISPRDRLRNWVRLYLATLCMLTTSFLLETVFGVAG